MIKKCPDQITACKLNCVVMPNGEVISKGVTLGMFREFKEELTEDKK